MSNTKIEGGLIIKGEAYIRVDVGSRHMDNDGSGKMVHLALLNIVDAPENTNEKRELLVTQQIELPAHTWPKVIDLLQREVASITVQEHPNIVMQRQAMQRLVNHLVQMKHENPQVVIDEETLRGSVTTLMYDVIRETVKCS